MCKSYLAVTSKAQDMACYVTAIYITRPDVLENYLHSFVDWIREVCFTVKRQYLKTKLSASPGAG